VGSKICIICLILLFNFRGVAESFPRGKGAAFVEFKFKLLAHEEARPREELHVFFSLASVNFWS
jgi:hypothetical protein